MAINYELLNKGIIPLGGNNFQLLGEVPLDSRLVVPTLEGLRNLIDNAAAYEGLIAYISSEKKHYEVKVIDGVLSYRPFGLTEDELNEFIANATTAAMEFKGATTTIPENPAKGDMYKVAGENINITIDNVNAKLGDSIVYDGTKWFLIPSGDDIEDTWRPVDGVNNDATLKFVNGDKTVAAVAADGTIKYNHTTVAAPTDVTADGDEKTRTYITAVETDGYGHITGYKTATENVEDTNTTYAFEGIDEEAGSNVYFTVTPSEIGDTKGSPVTVRLDAYTRQEADKLVADEIDEFNTTIVDKINERVKAIEDAPYTDKKYVDDQDAATLQAAKDYADGLDHEDTIYTVAPTENTLEFTVTPTGKGEAQTVKLVAPDVGVTKVVAGDDIVVTPADGTGVVTVAHKAYDTGTVKDVTHDDDKDPSFITGINIENGHVTGATVKNLKTVLQSMVVVLDGGTLKFTTDNL